MGMTLTPISDLVLPVGSVPLDSESQAWLISQSATQPKESDYSPQVKFRLPPPKVIASARANRQDPTTALNPSPYDAWFEKYGQQFGVDPGKLKRIANCESHLNPASNGTYKGMYQYHPGTWKSTRTAMGADPNPELVFDPEQAILTTAWKIAAGGLGAWPVCGQR